MSETKTESSKRGRTKSIVLSMMVLIVVWPATVLMLQRLRADEGRPLPSSAGAKSPAAIKQQAVPASQLVPMTMKVYEPSTGQYVWETSYHWLPISPQEKKSRELVGRIHQLRGEEKNEEREKLLAELKESLEAEFTARQTRQATEIEAAQQRLNSVKDMLTKRNELKDEIIQRRVNELIGQPDVLDWDPGPITQPVAGQQPRRTQLAGPGYSGDPAPGRVPDPPSRIVKPPRESVFGPHVRIHDSTRRETVKKTLRDEPAQSRTRVRPEDPSGPGVGSPPASTFRSDPTQRTDVFSVARRWVSTRLAAKTATEELERYQALHQRGAVTQSELSLAKAKAQQATAEAVLAEAEMQSLQRRLVRETDFATENLKRAEAIVENATSRHHSGTGKIETVLQAQGGVSAAKKMLADLKEAKEQLKKALELFDSQTETDKDPDPIWRDEDGDGEFDALRAPPIDDEESSEPETEFPSIDAPTLNDDASNDQEIAQRVVTALRKAQASGKLKGFGVDVQSKRGIVSLTGHVTSAVQRDRIAEIAKAIPGVQQVRNSISLQEVASPESGLNHPGVL